VDIPDTQNEMPTSSAPRVSNKHFSSKSSEGRQENCPIDAMLRNA